MTDKPCTHCGGSGREPDRAEQAYGGLMRLIDALRGEMTPNMRHHLQVAASGYQQAVAALADEQAARQVFLEAALRDILSYARENGPGTATIFQVGHDKVRDWRAILDGKREQP